MLPHQHVEPSHETQHIGVIIYLSQTILGMTLDFVPDVPFVKGNFEGFGGKSKVDSVDLG